MCPIKLVGFDLDDCLFDSTGLSDKARIKGIEAMIKLGLDINHEKAIKMIQEFDPYSFTISWIILITFSRLIFKPNLIIASIPLILALSDNPVESKRQSSRSNPTSFIGHIVIFRSFN